MRRFLIVLPVVLIAVVVGSSFGWKWVLAPLLAWAMIRWSFATFRSMVHDGQGSATGPEDGPAPVTGDERTLYWCEECGTEVLLLVRGSGTPLRHCGTRMHERTEIPN